MHIKMISNYSQMSGFLIPLDIFATSSNNFVRLSVRPLRQVDRKAPIAPLKALDFSWRVIIHIAIIDMQRIYVCTHVCTFMMYIPIYKPDIIYDRTLISGGYDSTMRRRDKIDRVMATYIQGHGWMQSCLRGGRGTQIFPSPPPIILLGQ